MVRMKCALTACLLFIVWSVALAQVDENRNNAINYINQQNLLPAGLSTGDNLIIKDQYHSKGVTHYYFQQVHDGIEVFNAITGVHINRSGQLVHVSNGFLSVKPPPLDVSRLISETVAMDNVAAHFELSDPDPINLSRAANAPDRASTWQAEQLSEESIPVKLVYDFDERGELKLCWDIAILKPDDKFWWDVRVDAQSGEVISKNSWTVECNWGDEHHAHDHSQCTHDHTHHKTLAQAKTTSMMNNSYNVYALPLANPDEGGRSIEVAPWSNAPSASPFGWHDTNGALGPEFTITRGNNVYASEDRNASNTPGASPDGTSTLEFDFPINLLNQPSSYIDAAITNLFYWNNIMHDVMYMYGFDEQSGNFQQNNYGNGGAAGDYVIADAQDGSGTNNANFSAPADGFSGRMQMFEWTGGSTDFDVNSPSGIAGGYTSAGAQFGPGSASVTGNLVIVETGGNPADTEACSAITNAAAINGNIALIDRGNCTFVSKVQEAEAAGAVAVVICNNVGGAPFTMAGTGSTTIPAVMISQGDCATIRAQIPTVNVTVDLNGANRDSDLDNLVIAHEYGHGVSIRLTGGPASSGCLSNNEQMGEGWSDYLGLVLTMKPGDVGTDSKAVGTYLQFQPLTGNGIRTYPYSTDFSINPHTYDDIASSVIPHGVGSVWCAMLWEMTWELIGVHGWDPDIYNGTGGNNIALQLVIEGMKLQGCSPGFVDGRDAILAADQLLYGGANQCTIWEAFARRGLGFSASQGSSNNTGDGSEAFDLPASCNGLELTKTAVATSNAGDTFTYTFTLTNNASTNLTNVQFSDNLPSGVNLVAGSWTCGTALGNNLFANFGTMTPGQSIVCTCDVTTSTTSFTTLVFQDDLESGTASWTTSTGTGGGTWTSSTANPNSGTTSWFVPNVGADNTQYLETQVFNPANVPYMSFFHSFDTETGWDGGYVQYSIDGGAWTSVPASSFTQNAYNGGLGNSSNATIAGEDAFTGNSSGYIESIFDLSGIFIVGTNTTVQFRFVFGSDNNTFNDGWYIDDVSYFDAEIKTNRACATTIEGFNPCATATTLIFEPTVSNPCTDITFNYNNVAIPDMTDKKVQQWITTTGVVTVGNGFTVDLSAGDYLLFRAGFEVAQNTDTHLYIEPCN